MVNAAIERAAESGDLAAEYRVVHPNGTVHWLEANVLRREAEALLSSK